MLLSTLREMDTLSTWCSVVQDCTTVDGSIGLVVRRVVLLEHVGLLALDHSCVTLLG